MREERFGSATIILADCREALEGVLFDAVVTDPPWQQARNILGAEDPVGLFAEVAPQLARARRVVVQLGDYSDPAILAPLAKHMQFLRACWLRYVPPSYRGRMLHEADLAYVYGSAPRSKPGRRVMPGTVTSTGRVPEEAEVTRSHGRNRRSKTAKATAARLAHPMARHLRHVRWLVQWFSDGDEVVLDPSSGSGTTGVACIDLGRAFLGFEADPRFFDVACRRLEQAARQLQI